jgi:hypothetical protein
MNTLKGFEENTNSDDTTMRNTQLWSRDGYAWNQKTGLHHRSQWYHSGNARHAFNRRDTEPIITRQLILGGLISTLTAEVRLAETGRR